MDWDFQRLWPSRSIRAMREETRGTLAILDIGTFRLPEKPEGCEHCGQIQKARFGIADNRGRVWRKFNSQTSRITVTAALRGGSLHRPLGRGSTSPYAHSHQSPFASPPSPMATKRNHKQRARAGSVKDQLERIELVFIFLFRYFSAKWVFTFRGRTDPAHHLTGPFRSQT